LSLKVSVVTPLLTGETENVATGPFAVNGDTETMPVGDGATEIAPA
jgi:hypothetical protein